MNSENTSGDADAGDWGDFANVKDIVPPIVKDQNVPAEYLISDHFLVPGVITQYFDEEVLFKPNFSDEIFNVTYNQIRHLPNMDIDYKHEVGDQVEVYMFDVKLNLHGWARSTITSIVKETYVVKLDYRNSFVIVQEDKIRTITNGANFNSRYLYIFNITVPQELKKFASNIEVHDSLCKAIGYPHTSYDTEKSALVISSNDVDCESIAKMLLEIHFDNLIQRMLLTESIDELGIKFHRMQTVDLLEKFEVHPDLLKYVIGKNGKNIRDAESIRGVTFITVLKDIHTVKIYGQNKAALNDACEYLQLDKEKIEISNEMIRKVIGKNAQKVQEIADQSKLRHIVINASENPTSDVVELEFIGTSASIADAKCLLEFHLDDLRNFNKLVIDNGGSTQQRNTVYGNAKTKSSSESPAEGGPLYRLPRRVVTGRRFRENRNFSNNVNGENVNPELMQFTDNQDLVFYNENLSRGRAGISLRGRSNVARRSRGRFGYQTTQFRVDVTESKNSNNQTVKQFQQSTAINRGRSRGRGRGRGRGQGRGLTNALVDGVNSISSRESQNDSSPDENHEQVTIQPLVEAGDASTSLDEQELEGQYKTGTIMRVSRNSQQRNTSGGTSDTSNQTAEIQAVPEDLQPWGGKSWRKRVALTSNKPTWQYENLSKVYYRKSSTNNSTDATGDSNRSATPEEEFYGEI